MRNRTTAGKTSDDGLNPPPPPRLKPPPPRRMVTSEPPPRLTGVTETSRGFGSSAAEHCARVESAWSVGSNMTRGNRADGRNKQRDEDREEHARATHTAARCGELLRVGARGGARGGREWWHDEIIILLLQ
eukprot:scaffold23351_cov42-Tisochrysis_lutea.AAC.3